MPTGSCQTAPYSGFFVCTDSEVDVTASNYTLQNLQPGAVYRVGVWEATEVSDRTCSPWRRFQTKALGNG